MRLLIVSNLDSARPFGQFLRPFYLGRGLARSGAIVANVGVECSAIDFGPTWSTGRASLPALARLLRAALDAFRPDVVYAHELRPAMAALPVARGRPLAVDFHSLPSVEWTGHARAQAGRKALMFRAAAGRAALAERLASRRADLVIASGEEVGAQLARRHRPARPLVVVPNGVDGALLDGDAAPPPAALDSASGPHAVTTLPAAGSPSNEVALRFLRAVADAAPQVAIHVLGRAEGPPARSLAYRGHQPSVLPWIEHADACLLPYPPEAALCGGARNKLLESLARGRRLVTTREGLRGLERAAGWEGVHLAPDDPAGFAETLEAAVRPGAAQLDPTRAAMRGLTWDALALKAEAALRDVTRSARRADGPRGTG